MASCSSERILNVSCQIPMSPGALTARLNRRHGSRCGRACVPGKAVQRIEVAPVLELAWSGRRSFDLDDDYDRGAAYKIILEEGREDHFRRYLNARLLRRYWQEILPARQVRALWEGRFPELRRAG
jgi:hypothetical protein